MQPATIGARIRVARNEAGHSYTIGGIYTVVNIDTDGTFRAADDNGRVGSWIRWDDCEPPDNLIWHRIAADLPEQLVRFLACFDGIGDVRLKEKVVDAVLERLPDLHERIVAAASTPAGEAAIAANRPPRKKPRKPADTTPEAASDGASHNGRRHQSPPGNP